MRSDPSRGEPPRCSACTLGTHLRNFLGQQWRTNKVSPCPSLPPILPHPSTPRSRKLPVNIHVVVNAGECFCCKRACYCVSDSYMRLPLTHNLDEAAVSCVPTADRRSSRPPEAYRKLSIRRDHRHPPPCTTTNAIIRLPIEQHFSDCGLTVTTLSSQSRKTERRHACVRLHVHRCRCLPWARLPSVGRQISTYDALCLWCSCCSCPSHRIRWRAWP